jgi:hypothetical protein
LKIFYYIFFLSFFFSCKKEVGSKVKNEPVIAEVGNEKLFLSEVTSLISKPADAADSIRMLRGLVNNWIKDQLMIIEAEKSLPRDINLDKMIKDYRASLLLFNYETVLAGELLDTVITTQQKEEYYNANSEQFVLAESIGRYIVAKIPSNAKGIDEFYKDWKKGNNGAVALYCKQNAEFYDSDDVKWKFTSQRGKHKKKR